MISSWKNLSGRFAVQQKKRTVLNILGVLMSAALITGTGTIIESVKRQMVESAIRREGNFHAAFRNVNREQAGIISGHINIDQSCRGKISRFAVLSRTGDEEIPYRLLRISENDPEARKMFLFENLLIEGRLPEKEGEIALDLTSMKILGPAVGIGSEITLPSGQRRLVSDDSVLTDFFYPLSLKEGVEEAEEYFEFEEDVTYRICGILDEELYLSENYSSNGLAYGDFSHPPEGELFNMLVLFRDLSDVRLSAESIADGIGLDRSNIVYNHRLLNVSGQSLNRGIRDSMTGFVGIVTAIIVIATVAVIYNSFNISLIERISQYGVLRCIGATPAQVRGLIVREAGLISLIGIPPGILIGLFAMKLVFTAADAMSSNILFEGIRLVVSPTVILSSALICSVTVFISALFPSFRAGRIPAVEAVRSTGMFSHDIRGGKKGGGFRFFPRSFAGIMAFRNLGRNRKRFFVTLFSMVISVTLFVAFGGMLRLVEDSYIISDLQWPGLKLESEKRDFDTALYDELKDIDSVELLIKYGSAEADFLVEEQKLSTFYGDMVQQADELERRGDKVVIPGSRIISYGDDAFREVAQRNGIDESAEIIFVRKALFRNERNIKSYGPNSSLDRGDSLGVEIDGVSRTVRIEAAADSVYYEDFNSTEGAMDLIVTERRFKELTGRSGYRELFIRLKPGADKEGLKAYLDQLTMGKVGYSYVDAQSRADDMIGETRAINMFFYGFILVIALISSLNIINTISTNLLIRSKEFGIIQAVGLDRKGLRQLILLESLIYCLISLLIGGLLGTGIWYLLVREMSGIRMTLFSIPWLEIGIAAAALSVVVLLSGHIPMKRIYSKTIVENIRREE